jgi:hypothetical protein
MCGAFKKTKGKRNKTKQKQAQMRNAHCGDA